MSYGKFVQIAITMFVGTITIVDTVFGQDVISNEEKQAINKLIEDYIMDNPEVIFKSLEEMRKRERLQEQEGAKKNLIALEDEIMRNPTDPVGGNIDGDITIVEFFDYRCGYCKQFFTALNAVLNEDDNLRIVFKELPILGPSSELAAKAAIAASRQNLYIPFHNRMMSLKGRFDEKKLFDIAKEVGLDLTRLRKDMDLRGVQGVLDGTKALANKLSISGTPAIIVGSEIVRGAISKDRLKAMIAAARE